MRVFDVIIIGAGPAGLNCAKILGDSSLRVLLVEKNSVIGPKVCAGGLTNKSLQYLNLPDSLIERKFNQIKLHVNNKSSQIKHDDFFVYTINRQELGQWQLKQLEQCKNITVQTNTLVTKISKDLVIINGQRINYKYLVGADGPASVVRNYLEIKNKLVGIGLQYLVPTDKFRDLEIFFKPKYFKSWYAWIFPHKNFTSIGCGGFPRSIHPKKLRNNFEEWLKEKNINISNAKYEAFPINCDYQGYKFGNIYLAGDACGLASPLTGEGIYQALISGEETAKMILDETLASKNLSKLLKTRRKHLKYTNILTLAGPFRTYLLHTGRLLMQKTRFKNKVIKRLG